MAEKVDVDDATIDLIVAAARATGSSDTATLIEAALALEQASRLLAAMRSDQTRRFTGTITKVAKVKTQDQYGNPLPGKAKIVLASRDQQGNEQEEEIETEWLSDPIALYVAKVAKANIGKQVVVYKALTDPDPPKAPQGYRFCRWIDGPVKFAASNGASPNGSHQAAQAGGQSEAGAGSVSSTTERSVTAPPPADTAAEPEPVQEAAQAAHSRPSGRSAPKTRPEPQQARQEPQSAAEPAPAAAEPVDPYGAVDEQTMHRVLGLFNQVPPGERRDFTAWRKEQGFSMPPANQWEAACEVSWLKDRLGIDTPDGRAETLFPDQFGAKTAPAAAAPATKGDPAAEHEGHPLLRPLSENEATAWAYEVFGDGWDADIVAWEGEYPNYPEGDARAAMAEWDAYLAEVFPEGVWTDMDAATLQRTIRKIMELRATHRPLVGVNPDEEPW